MIIRFRKAAGILALACVICSCENRQTRYLLKDVETYIQEAPDSALAVLETIRPGDLNTPSLKADYSLLYAAALDKNYVDTTDLEIIQPAVKYYYQKHSPVDKEFKAHFYQGVIYYNRKEYNNAIVSFSKAEELILEGVDSLYIGLLYSRMSDTYNKVFNTEEEYRYIEYAEEVFNKIGAQKYYHSTLCRKGEALMNQRRYPEAEHIFQSIISDDSAPSHIRRMAKEDYALVLVTKYDRDIQTALSLFEDVLSEGRSLRNTNLWGAYAYALFVCGLEQESNSIFEQLYSLSNYEYSTVDIWKSAVYENGGNYQEAYCLLQNSLTFQDSLLNIRLAQTTSRAQRDYLTLRNRQIQLESNNSKLLLCSVIAILIIISVVLFALFYFRNERLKRERNVIASVADMMENQLKESERIVAIQNSEILVLQNEINDKEKILEQLRMEYARMYKTQFRYLGNLCETYLLANEKKESQRIVYEKVQDMIKCISCDQSGHKHFEEMINRSLNNIMKHFRDDFPYYSEDDYRFVSYLFVGFDATNLCIILKMPSVAAVYVKKSRIKKMISESNAIYKIDYLEMLK